MATLRGVTAVLAFALELVMLAALAYWGVNATTNTAAGIGLAVVVDAAVIGLWGVALAPRSARRIGWPSRVIAEIALLAVSAAALAVAGQISAAALFSGAIVVRFVLGFATGLDRVDDDG